MNIIRISFILTILLLRVNTYAEAQCRKVQVCDDYGMNCVIKQVCASTLDLPSIGLDPVTPLPSTQVKPLPSTGLPPLGTTNCEYKQVNGVWQNICKE